MRKSKVLFFVITTIMVACFISGPIVYFTKEGSDSNKVQNSNQGITGGTVATYNTPEKMIELDDGDISFIQNLWNNDNWNTEGTSEGLSDCVVVIEGLRAYYNSDNGVFNDVTNHRFMTVDTETKKYLNECLSKYIELGGFD